MAARKASDLDSAYLQIALGSSLRDRYLGMGEEVAFAICMPRC